VLYSMFYILSAVYYILVLSVVLLLYIVVSSIIGPYVEPTLLCVLIHFYKMSVLVVVKALCNLAFLNV
jgi:hypothetical protein